MKEKEIFHIIMGILILSIVIGFKDLVLYANYSFMGYAILFSAIIIIVNVLAKKGMASFLDSRVEHKIWFWKRLWFKQNWNLKNAIPTGAIIPLFISAFSIGFFKVMAVLTFETFALKRRAARKFGYYSYTELTDFTVGMIATAGIVATLLLSLITYWFEPLETLSRMAAYYAFWNIIPFSTLDGIHILSGIRKVWYVLATITAIFALFALYTGLV
ncbi:hypothetical protein CO155_03340 [Candidatus Pacearchaeota archaeon CG_4_9_14_3_um_filter_35_19]|nr:MAG: hypothetical protein CO155_03340 [Candidatus Pacearchaeota archaeon CG_4_9_14_3_um_filter_35_19]